MKIKFSKDNAEQVELFKQMGSKNAAVTLAAQEAFAELSSPIVSKVIDQASLYGMIFTPFGFNEDENPTLPLDLYVDAPVGTFQVWSQPFAGGLATNEPYGLQELKFTTFRLESAVSFNKKYLRKSYLDVVAKGLNRLSQEVINKVNLNAFSVLLGATVQARTNGATHIISSTTQDVLQIDDFNRLITLGKRISQSFANGTPVEDSYGATDYLLSPELMEQIRAFAYQPMNTRTVNGTVGTPAGSSTAMPLPDSVRERIYAAAGASEIFGKTLHEVWEFGDAQKYNYLFGQYAGSATIARGSAFAPATDQFMLGLNLAKDAFIQPIAQNADSGATFTVSPDDQWPIRQDKIGFYGGVECGFVSLDGKCCSALIV